MNFGTGAILTLTLTCLNFVKGMRERLVVDEHDLPGYIEPGSVTFDQYNRVELRGLTDDPPLILFDFFFQRTTNFLVCTERHDKCQVPVPVSQRAVLCFHLGTSIRAFTSDCPDGMSGIEFFSNDAPSGNFRVRVNETISGTNIIIDPGTCVNMTFESNSASWEHDFLKFDLEHPVILLVGKVKHIHEMSNNWTSENRLKVPLYVKNTNPRCGTYFVLKNAKLYTYDAPLTTPDDFKQDVSTQSGSTESSVTNVKDDAEEESVASATFEKWKIAFIVIGAVVIICFAVTFGFLLYQRQRNKELAAQSISDHTNPLTVQGVPVDAHQGLPMDRPPTTALTPSTELQSTPGTSAPASTAQLNTPTEQKSEVSAMTAVPPPKGLRAMRTTDELYRLALTADVRVERNVYLDLAIESANEEIRAWEKSPAGRRKEISTLPIVAQRIIAAKTRNLKMLQSKVPNRLLPEQVDGLNYEDINDLALIETKSMNVRYALFDMACDSIKRAYEEAYATANFEKEAVDPLVYQVQLGVLELNEEPLRLAEQRRRLVEDYLRLKGIIIKEGVNSKS